MRRARKVIGSDGLETNSFKDMILGHPSRKLSLTLIYYQAIIERGRIQPEDQCSLSLTIQAIRIGTTASLENPSGDGRMLTCGMSIYMRRMIESTTRSVAHDGACIGA
jgi:hypothetical protein